MVMDAQPSPQSVGREFVRQYYTLLNKAPNYLHRFYNNHSSFIHDGLDAHNCEATLVIGQKNIHNKIQQLNFRDCHAKISQVDAQATLGNGVVVQVTGELSNDGQPMRRFTQTFVLAPQSPKNYYVHNDIFRYQDLYSDDENEVENRSENGEEQDSEVKQIENQQNPMGQPQQLYYQLPTATVAPLQSVGQSVSMPPFNSQQPQINGVVHDELLQTIQQPSQVSQIAPTAVASVSQPNQSPPATIAIVDPIATIPAPSASSGPISQSTATLPLDVVIKRDINLSSTSATTITQDVPAASESVNQEPGILKKDEFVQSDQAEKSEAIKVAQNEPKTYANLFKTANTSSSSISPLSLPTHQISTGQSTKVEPRPDNQVLGPPQRTNSTRQIKDFAERRTSNVNAQFGDSHQLFLGNVPHHATEEELKALFSKFGTVVDLRIHSKPGSKVPGVRLPPNYGFITYEDPESVQNCLAHCPLYFPDNSPDGQKLNVEEKKTKLRTTNDMPRLPNSMSNSGMGNSQRPSGGPNRSLSNTSGLIRTGSGGNGPVRGSTGGPRPSGGFNRNDNRGPGGPSTRGNGNVGLTNSGGNSYGRR